MFLWQGPLLCLHPTLKAGPMQLPSQQLSALGSSTVPPPV